MKLLLCTALPAKQVNIVLYCFTSLHLTFTLNVTNVSTVQFVKGAPSSNLSFAESAIVWTPNFPISLVQVTNKHNLFCDGTCIDDPETPVSYLIQCDASTTCTALG